MATNFSQTFADGLRVETVNGKFGTNCSDQAEWLNVNGLGRIAKVLKQNAPVGTTTDQIIALAFQQQRAAWMGLQGLNR